MFAVPLRAAIACALVGILANNERLLTGAEVGNPADLEVACEKEEIEGDADAVCAGTFSTMSPGRRNWFAPATASSRSFI